MSDIPLSTTATPGRRITNRNAQAAGESSAPAANETQQNMRNVFLAAGAGGIIQYWLRSGMQTEPGQVAAVIAALCEGAALAAMPQ